MQGSSQFRLLAERRFGPIGLTLFGVDLWLAAEMHAPHGAQTLAELARDASHRRVLADLLLIGIFGDFYIVPLYALVQTRSDPAHRSGRAASRTRARWSRSARG